MVVADGELAARARLLNQPFRKHARTGRPWVLFKSAMTLDGKVATRGGDSKWISSEDEPLPRPPLARRVRRRGGRDRDRARRRPAADGAGRGRRAPAAAGRVRLARAAAARLASSSATRREIPLTVVVSRAAPRAATDALETHGAEVIVATGENEPARVRSALDQLGASGDRPRSCSRAARTWPARSSTPARSTRSACSSHRCVLGGRTARDPLEGEGVETIADAVRALTLDCERIGEDLLISARLKEW